MDEAERQRVRVAGVEQEPVWDAFLAIADVTSSFESMPIFYAALQRIVGALIPAENWYIALFDALTGIVSFPYLSEAAAAVASQEVEDWRRSLTAYVMRSGQPLL